MEDEVGAGSSPGIIAPPPLLYLGAFSSAIALNLIHGWPLAERSFLLAAIGLIFLVSGIAIVTWSFFTMRRLGTSADPRKSTRALATVGPFRYVRNPIYLAMTLAYLGGGWILNSFWPLLLLVPLLLVMHHGVILREERYLEKLFGKPYLEYKSRTRRWL